MIVLVLLAFSIAILIAGIFIGIPMGRDDERARQHENQCFVGALNRHDCRPIR